MRSAFTMLEIIFVIVITGLVSIAGSMAIVHIMQNYALQKEYAKLEIDSASAINQISKYLQNSIWDSIAIKSGNNSYTDITNVNTSAAGSLSATNSLVFISKNIDVLNGYFDQTSGSNIPYFSGFIDLSTSSGTTINTAFSKDKLRSLSSLANLSTLGIYFPFVNKDGDVVAKYYHSNTVNRTSLFGIVRVNSDNGMTLTHAPSKIGDVAMIVNTNPASISLSRNGDNGGDVVLTTHKNERIVIANNVSNLHIWSEYQSDLLRIRLCFVNKPMRDFMPEFCKEGVIMQ